LDVEYCIVGAGFAGCKSIPLDEPWDRTTLAQWLDDNVKSNQAHGSLEMAVAGNRQATGFMLRCTISRPPASHRECAAKGS
jgi:hypothetical protein